MKNLVALRLVLNIFAFHVKDAIKGWCMASASQEEHPEKICQSKHANPPAVVTPV